MSDERRTCVFESRNCLGWMAIASLIGASVVGCSTPYRRQTGSSPSSGGEDASYERYGDPRFPHAPDGERTGVWFEEPRISGRLSPTAVVQAASRHRSAIDDCRRAGGGEPTDLSGRAVLELKVRADGSIERADIRETSLHDRDFQTCLLEAVRVWQLPATDGPQPATVQLPLNVRPERREDPR